MKKFLTIILIAGAISMALSSCSKTLEPDSSFVDSSEIKLAVKGQTICTYDPLDWQLGYDVADNEFWMSEDPMQHWVSVKCSDVPKSKGQKLDATVSWSTSNGENSMKGKFEVVKAEGNKYWLWCGTKSKQIAVTVCVLE